MSDEHFTVDGTLIEVSASQKSFQRKDGRPDGDGRDFHGDSRTNDTHASTTDPDAKLYPKGHGHEARLAYLGHLVIENRHGLIVDAMASTADGRTEREVATVLLHDQRDTSWLALADRRGGQGLRYARVCRRCARPGVDAACRAEHRARGRQCDRSADDTPCELRQESARSAAHRAGVRLAENDRMASEGQTPGPVERPLARLLRGRRVQPAPPHHVDGGAGLIRSADARSAIRGLQIPDQRFRIKDEGSESAIGRISASS
jgi:hypothetical protein